MPTKLPKRAPSAAAPRSRSKPPGDDLAAGIGLALLLGGAAALLTAALADKYSGTSPSTPRYILGGVDLTGVNLSQPFWIDFSVPQTASIDVKRQALDRIRTTLLEFQRVQPNWFCQVLGSIDSDQFGLYVTPLANLLQEPENT
jgi:hypothetical protein